MPEIPPYEQLHRGVEELPDGSVPDGQAWVPPPPAPPPGFPPLPDVQDPRDAPLPRIIGEEIGLATKRRPLVLVPGIMATDLWTYDPGTGASLHPIWPPLNLATGATPYLAQLYGPCKRPPAGNVPLVSGAYDRLIEFLTSMLGYELGRTLFVFGYDWTRTNRDSGQRLAGAIRAIVDRHPWPAGTADKDKTVDVICHSMGGLVTRAAIRMYGAAVERTVYVASPHYGSPKAFGVLNAKCRLLPWIFDLGLRHVTDLTVGSEGSLEATLKWVAAGMQSAFELLPDEVYFAIDNSISTVFAKFEYDAALYSFPSPPPVANYTRTVSGLNATYFADAATGFDDVIATQRAQWAMAFKARLGKGLPGRHFVIAGESRPTDDQVDFVTRGPNGTSPTAFTTASAVHGWGDETVPYISGKGPGAHVVVNGNHCDIPNLPATAWWIAYYLSR